MSQIGVTSTGSHLQARINLELGADIVSQIYHGGALARKTRRFTTKVTERGRLKYEEKDPSFMEQW
jgi:hypothetical protein